MEKIKLFIINGFLGAGKTTMLQELCQMWPNEKIAIVVNEFGSTSMDGVILKYQAIKLTEINNGSIFCSCRSDSFIEALITMSKMNLSTVIVESSGLSNPRGMGKILSLVQKLTEEAFDYRGSVTLVDALGFEDVRHTSVMAREQVVSSDLIVINKIDLVGAEEIKELTDTLRALNPFAVITQTSFAKIKPGLLDSLNSEHSASDQEWQGGRVIGTQKLLFALEGNFQKSEIMQWLKDIAPYLFRIKGFVLIEGKWSYIDSTNKSLIIRDAPFEPEEKVAVILAPGNKPIIKEMETSWQSLFGQEEKTLKFI